MGYSDAYFQLSLTDSFHKILFFVDRILFLLQASVAFITEILSVWVQVIRCPKIISLLHVSSSIAHFIRLWKVKRLVSYLKTRIKIEYMFIDILVVEKLHGIFIVIRKIEYLDPEYLYWPLVFILVDMECREHYIFGGFWWRI